MDDLPEGGVSWEGWPGLNERLSPRPVGYNFFMLGRCPCEDTDGPHCLNLVTEAVETLSVRTRWPDHTNDRVFAEACRRWARTFFLSRTLDGAAATPWAAQEEHPEGGELAFRSWQAMWPLPIGWRALAQAHAEGDFPEDASPQRLLNFLPFEGPQWATYIAWGAFGRTLATVFATVVPEYGNDNRITGYRGGPLGVVVAGDYFDAPDMEKFVEGARRWWNQLTDQKIGPGRPRGPQVPLQDYLDAYRVFCVGQDRRPKSQEEFCEVMQRPYETMRDHLKGWGIRWSVFQRWDMTGPFPPR